MFALKKVVTVKILYSLIARKTVRYYSIEGFWRCPIFQTSILYIGCNNCRPKILCCTLYTSPQSCHKPILIKSVKISVTYWRLVTGTVFTPGFSHPLSSHGSFLAHPLSSHGSFFAHPLSSHGSFFAHPLSSHGSFLLMRFHRKAVFLLIRFHCMAVFSRMPTLFRFTFLTAKKHFFQRLSLRIFYELK